MSTVSTVGNAHHSTGRNRHLGAHPLKHQVTIDRDDFIDALRPVAELVQADDSGQQALVYMEGNELTFSLRGVSVSMSVDGTWPGEVRVSSNSVLTLAKAPPRGDPLTIEVKGDRFRIGTFTAPCHIQKAWRSEIDVPMDAELADILALGYQYSMEELERAGYLKAHAAARSKLDELAMLAAESLTELRISPLEVRELLDEWIKRRSCISSTDGADI